MTPLQIKQVAAEIAARIPAMAQDCATNNAVVIEGMLTEAFGPVKSYAESDQFLDGHYPIAARAC